MSINLIAAVDSKWGIGKDDRLLCSIPEDMKMFKSRTVNNIVVYGRKTMETFPHKKPLLNRENLVLTRTLSPIEDKNTIVFANKSDLINYILAPDETREIYIIGGASVYKQFLDVCTRAYITKIEGDFEADTFMPNLDDDPNWEITEESEEKEYNGIKYRFYTYERKGKTER